MRSRHEEQLSKRESRLALAGNTYKELNGEEKVNPGENLNRDLVEVILKKFIQKET